MAARSKQREIRLSEIMRALHPAEWLIITILFCILVLVAIGLLTRPARADDVDPQQPIAQIIRKGQPAPHDGELLNVSAVIKIVGEIRAARERAAIIETLEAENHLREQQNQYLRGAADLAEKMADLAQKNAQENQAVLQHLTKVIDTNGEVLKQNQAVIESNIKVIESMQKEIESLRKERRWAMIAGPIGLGIGLLLGQFGGGFFQ